ncbi:MAG: GntR family transcriptional regulator, partial [Clostridiales bacterium]|nr:GntR family transcriptional regulator [Clostridiales bacterium]
MVLKYKIISEWINEQIEKGRFSYGDKLPSENELAKKFNMSRQTVRHAVDILEFEKVVKRVKGSGTYLNKQGRVKREKSHRNIAVVSTYIDNYVFPPILGGIERVLSDSGYTIQIAFTENKALKEREVLLGLVQSGHIDGLIIEPAKSALPNINTDLYEKLDEKHIPVLLFNCPQAELRLPCVALDDRLIGYKCAKYLIDAGHTKICGIFKSDDKQDHLRYEGFMKGLIEADINEENVFWMNTDSIENMEYIEEYIINRLKGKTGLVCYNDQVAYKIAALCQRRGIKIPEELSVIGVDHLEQISETDLKITSFPHPLEALGVKAAENMLKMIENPLFDGNYLFDSEVEERDSVKFIDRKVN